MAKKQSTKRVTVVTVTHNSAAVIEPCLASIPKGVEVYVVDNASGDDSVARAKSARHSAYILENKKNLGFGRANNLALKKVKTEFALVLNPDTVLQPDTIRRLLEVADTHKEAAIIAPTIFYADGSIQKTYKNSVFKREQGKSAYVRPEGDMCAECLSGAAMLLRMSAFRKIGFFDEEIFLFYEDDDLCLRVREAGYSLVITPYATLMHHMGKSSPASYYYIFRKNWHMMWSRLYIEHKYNGLRHLYHMALKEMYVQLGKALGHVFMLNTEKTVKSVARMVAVFAFVAGIKATPRRK